MAKVGAQRAAELTGKSKSTIQRAMNAGKLSFEVDANSRRLIDVSELERVFGLQSQSTQGPAAPASENGNAAMELELERARHAIEVERLKMEVRLAQEQAENAMQQIEDLKVQRDLWQKQAQQILITSQYSQKQSEERIAEMQAREEARKAQADARRMQGAVQHTPRPQNPQRAQIQQPAPERSVPQQSQGPIFRTVQPGNQNRNLPQQQQKTSLFASLFGGKKARRV